MPECTFYEELISAKLDGALTLEEDAQLCAHLEGCAACRALARELEAMQAQMPALSPRPPADLMGRIMAETARTAQEKPRKMPRARVWGSLAAVLALVLVGMWMWKPWQETEVPLQMSGTLSSESATPAPAEEDVAADTPESTAEEAEDVAVVTGAALPDAAAQTPAAAQSPEQPSTLESPEEAATGQGEEGSAAGRAGSAAVASSMTQAKTRLEEYLAAQEMEDASPEAENTTNEMYIVSSPTPEGGAAGGGSASTTTADTEESISATAETTAGGTLVYLGMAGSTYYFMQPNAAGTPVYYAVDASGEITAVEQADLPASWDA